jgi:hypothetical protein
VEALAPHEKSSFLCKEDLHFAAHYVIGKALGSMHHTFFSHGTLQSFIELVSDLVIFIFLPG